MIAADFAGRGKVVIGRGTRRMHDDDRGAQSVLESTYTRYRSTGNDGAFRSARRAPPRGKHKAGGAGGTVIEVADFACGFEALTLGGMGPGLPRREEDRHILLRAVTLSVGRKLAWSERHLGLVLRN
jgi:hypothetical protein